MGGVSGYIDSVGVRSVRGWAADSDGGPARLIVMLNGQPKTSFSPNIHRADLDEQFGPEARLGFEIDIGHHIAPGDTLAVVSADGGHLTNSPTQATEVGGGKAEKALAMVDRSMSILEIGPSFSPIAPRAQGWNSYSLDHASQEELQAKYAGQQLVENIEPVDFIWRGGPVADAVPAELHGSFDVIIASHVIEHFPDTIGFYLSAAQLLKQGGLISLVVPDKRLTFDFFKPVSLTSDLIAAHSQGRTRHTKKTAFDNAAYNVYEHGDVAWYVRPLGDFSFAGAAGALQQGTQLFTDIVEDESASYVDFHNTIYTPASFQLIMLELGQLGMIPFSVALHYPSSGCEFYVTLRKGAVAPMPPDALSAERLRLLLEMVRELGQQASWLSSATATAG